MQTTVTAVNPIGSTVNTFYTSDIADKKALDASDTLGISDLARSVLSAPTVPGPDPRRHEASPGGSAYAEFTKRLEPSARNLIAQKWREIPNLPDLAKELTSDLRENPYASPLFFRQDVEFIALYALREGFLTVFETANILKFKRVCDAYGKGEVKVHFLRDAQGKIDEVEASGFVWQHLRSLRIGERKIMIKRSLRLIPCSITDGSGHRSIQLSLRNTSMSFFPFQRTRGFHIRTTSIRQ